MLQSSLKKRASLLLPLPISQSHAAGHFPFGLSFELLKPPYFLQASVCRTQLHKPSTTYTVLFEHGLKPSMVFFSVSLEKNPNTHLGSSA